MLEEVKGENARIRLLDQEDGKTRTVAVGQEILGMRVEKVVYEMDSDKNGQPVDRSWVELLDAEKKGRVVLVKDVSARSEASNAVLVAADGEEVVVRQGETFEWPAQSGARYRVVDLRAQQAVVREVDGGRMWTIPPQ
jgi:ABC-type Fe3+ transport system substrate-binding protein